MALCRARPLTGSEPAKAQYIAMRNDVRGLVKVMPVIVMSAIEAQHPQSNRRLDGWLHDNKRGVHLRMNAAGYIKNIGELRAIHGVLRHANRQVIAAIAIEVTRSKTPAE